jgi:hypothetical protein
VKRVTTPKRGMPPFTITPRVSLAPERVGPVVEPTPLEVMAPCVECRSRVARGLDALALHPACGSHLRSLAFEEGR